MKPKKAKKQRPNVHMEFRLTNENCRALSDALLFLLSLKDFSFEDEKISRDSADSAEEKLSCNMMELTRGEVRATAKAIDEVLYRLPNESNDYTFMEEDFPDLIYDLRNSLIALQELQPIFQTAVKDLRKMN